MSISYTLRFSDPSKTNTITVNGPNKNTVDTSLNLIGPGYVNYGQDTAQNLLKLLENFSSPNPPINPIEGQLWYDTSNPSRKILRINNGSLTSARWPSANGIYQQANDPSIQYSQNLIDGDVWVDTGNTQLKIRYGDTWTLVGPNVSTGDDKTGTESVNLVSNTGRSYPVILNWVNGKVVEIIAYDSFVPRTVIDGFASLNPGVNLTNKVTAKYNGLADRASALEISTGIYIQANEVLKNTWPASQRQVHSGSLIVEAPQGLFVRRSGSTREIQINTTQSNALGVINFGYSDGALKVGINDSSYIRFNGSTGRVGINTSVNTGTLTVNGGTYVNGSFTTTGNLNVSGSAQLGGNLNLTGNLILTGGISSTGSVITYGDIIPGDLIRSIGSASKPFENIYVANIGNSSTYVRIFGSVTTATQLETSRLFQVIGHSTSTAVAFNGTTSTTFTTTLTRNAINSPAGGATQTTTATQTLLVLNTATTNELESISKYNFLSDVYPGLIQSGMIISAGTSTGYTGYLYCDGSQHTATTYSSLFSKIGNSYGSATPGFFRVPNLTTSTISGTNGAPIYYHIKT